MPYDNIKSHKKPGFTLSVEPPLPTVLALKGLRTIKIFQYKNLLLLKPPKITISGIQHCNHWEKKKSNNFFFHFLLLYFCHFLFYHFQIWWNIFVNDGDIKGIAHKFWWEYLMYCFWNLLCLQFCRFLIRPISFSFRMTSLISLFQRFHIF